MIKVTQRIPTEQYAYIEFEKDYDNVEESMIDHVRLIKEYTEGAGLSVNDWAKVRNNMLKTGEVDVNLLQDMNKAQRYWVNETKNALRAIKDEQ